MATTVGTLVVNVIGNAAMLNASLSAAERTIERFGNRLFFLGARITAGLTLPIVGMVTQIAKIGSEFDQAMTESLAIMGDVTDEQRKQMEDLAIDISKQSKFAAKEIAKGYYDLASAGLNVDESLRGIGIVADFAQAGMLDMGNAGEYLAGAVSSVGLELLGTTDKVQGMARVADVLTAANNRALGTVEDFSKALTKQFGGVMKQYNIALEDGVALLMGYAENNIRGARASTMASMAIRDVQVSTIRAGDAWRKYGVSVFSAGGQLRKMPVILDQILMRMKGFTKEQIEQWMLTGIKPEAPAGKAMSALEQTAMFKELQLPFRSISAIQQLLKSGGQISEFAEQLRNSAGETARVADKQMESVANRWAAAWHTMEAAAIRMFEAYKPVIFDIIDLIAQLGEKLEELAIKFDGLSEPTKRWIGYLVAGVALIGPIIGIIGSWALAFSGLLNLMRGFTTGLFNILRLLPGMNSAAMAAQGAANQAVTGTLTLTGRLAIAGRALTFLAADILPLYLMFKMLGPAIQDLLKWIGVLDSKTGELNTSILDHLPDWEKWGKTILNIAKFFGQLMDLIQFGWRMIVQLAKLIGEDLAQAWETTKKFASDAWVVLKDFIEYIPFFGPIIIKLGELFISFGKIVFGVFSWLFDQIKNMFSPQGILVRLNKAIFQNQYMPKEIRELAKVFTDAAESGGDFHERLARGTSLMDQYLLSIGAASDELKEFDRTQRSLKPALTRTGVAGGDIPVHLLQPGKPKPKPKSWREVLGLPPTPGGTGLPGAPEYPLGTPKREVRDPVQEAYERLMGEGTREWENVMKAWDLHKAKILENEDAVERLGDEYLKIRDKIDQVPEFERMFETRIAVENMERWQKAFGAFMADVEQKGAGALSPILNYIDQWAVAQKGIIDQAGIGAKVFGADFFKKHGEEIEYLATMYDKMGPGVRLMIDEYREWQRATQAMSDAERELARETQALTSIFRIHGDMAAQLADKEEELTNFRLSESERGLKGIAKNLAQQRLAYNREYAAMANELKQLSGQELDVAIQKFLEFQRMGEQWLRTSERLAVEQLALQLGVDEKILKSFKHMTKEKVLELGKLAAAIQSQIKLWNAWAGIFGTLAGIFDKEGKGWLSWAATMAEAMARATEGAGKMKQGIEGMKGVWDDWVQNRDKGVEFDWEAMMGDITTFVEGVVAAIDAMDKATASSSKARNIAGGAMTGMKIGGAILPGWGHVIGLAVGALVGALRGRRLRDTIRMTAKEWGVEISDELAKAINDTADKIGFLGGGRQMAQLMHFSEILEEAGGLNLDNFETFRARFTDVFTFLEHGWIDSGEAMDIYMEHFGTFADFVDARGGDLATAFQDHMQIMTDQLRRGLLTNADIRNFFEQNFDRFVQSMDRIGGVASKAWKDVLNLAKATGRLPKVVSDFLIKTAGEASDAWVLMIKGATTEFSDLKDKIKEAKDEIEKSTKALEDFDEEMKGQELSNEDLEKRKELLDDIAKAQGDLAKLTAEGQSFAGKYKVEMERLGFIVLSTFNASIEAGVDWLSTMDKLGPSLDELIEAYDILGISTENAALAELLRMRQLMKANEALFAGVGALTQGLIALSRLGGVNQTTFAALEQQTIGMFRRVQGEVARVGGSHADALRPFIPFLQEAERLAREQGIVLDENTQIMIDQARELGLLGPEAKSSTDIMEQGFQDVVSQLDILIGRLDILLQHLGYVGDAIGNMPDFPEAPTTPRPPTVAPPPGDEGGGGGWGGGAPSPVSTFATANQASALNTGYGFAAPRDITINVPIQTTTAVDEHFVVTRVVPHLVKATSTNRGGSRTRLRDVLK